jgi:hypothetical protein
MLKQSLILGVKVAKEQQTKVNPIKLDGDILLRKKMVLIAYNIGIYLTNKNKYYGRHHKMQRH